MSFRFNRDTKRRDEIIFGDYKPEAYKLGGIRRFENLTLEQFKLLYDEKFIDPEDCQNSAPSAEDFINFMQENPQFTAHGYAVSPERNDYRVTIEGLDLDGETSEETKFNFVHFARHADEFTYEQHRLRCWWD